MATRSVTTAFRILESVAQLQPAGLSDLSRATGTPKATAQRMLITLEELGWIEKSSDSDSKWSIAIHAYAITSKGSTGSSIRDAALGPMNALQIDTSETVHLAVPDSTQMVVIERLDTPHILRAFLALGSRLLMHASSTGLAYLASTRDSFVSEYLKSPLEMSTPYTLSDADAVRREIAEIRHRGYSINQEGLSVGITSLGAAIVTRESVPVGSVSVSGPSSRITEEKFAQYGEAVMSAARSISAGMPR